MYNKCSIKVRDDDKDSLWNIFNGKIFTPKQHEAADTLVQHRQVSAPGSLQWTAHCLGTRFITYSHTGRFFSAKGCKETG